MMCTRSSPVGTGPESISWGRVQRAHLDEPLSCLSCRACEAKFVRPAPLLLHKILSVQLGSRSKPGGAVTGLSGAMDVPSGSCYTSSFSPSFSNMCCDHLLQTHSIIIQLGLTSGSVVVFVFD